MINSVDPSVVSTEGEKGVQIRGANFQVGVRVFIDGLEVKNIKRDPASQLISFDAPPGREGETRLIVMNPDGVADSAQFIYVKTQTDPRINSISPAEGTINTVSYTHLIKQHLLRGKQIKMQLASGHRFLAIAGGNMLI